MLNALPVVRENTSVPVPKVLAWSTETESSSVGAEYMITDAAPGVPLKDVWNQMTGLQHIECIRSIASIAKELCGLEFTTLGSLYLDTPNKPPGCIPLDGKYCVGPHCARQHWGYDGVGKRKELDTSEGCQGPCKS